MFVLITDDADFLNFYDALWAMMVVLGLLLLFC